MIAFNPLLTRLRALKTPYRLFNTVTIIGMIKQYEKGAYLLKKFPTI